MRKNVGWKVMALLTALSITTSSVVVAADASDFYLKIGSSADKALVMQLSGDSVRIAESVEKLPDAEAIKCQKKAQQGGYILITPEIPLQTAGSATDAAPVPKAKFTLYARSSRPLLYGSQTLELKGADGAKWSYSSRMRVTPSTDVDKASLVMPLAAKDIKFRIQNRPNRRDKLKMGIGVELMSASGVINDVKKNGQSVNTSVQVTDAAGKVVSKVDKTLSRLGYG